MHSDPGVRCPAAVLSALMVEEPSYKASVDPASHMADAVWSEALAEYQKPSPPSPGCGERHHLFPIACARPADRGPRDVGAPVQGRATPQSKQCLDNFFSMATELERLNSTIAGGQTLNANNRGASEVAPELGVSLQPADLHEELLLSLRTSKEEKTQLTRAADLFRKRSFVPATESLVELLRGRTLPLPSKVLITNAAAASSFMAERWTEATELSRRCLELCEDFDVALRRLCRLAVITADLAEAQRLTRPHRKCAWWGTELRAVSELERYTALQAAARPTEAAQCVDRLLTLLPCGQIECLRVRLLLGESRRAAAAYAVSRCLAYPNSADLRCWCCEAQFQGATSAKELAMVRERVQQALRDHPLSTALRTLATRVQDATATVETIESLAASLQWEKVVTRCTEALHAAQGGGTHQPTIADGVAEFLYTQRAKAFWEHERIYQALDDAQRALASADEDASRGSLLLLVAHCEEKLNRLRDAIYHVRQVLYTVPPHVAPSAQGYLGELESKLRQQREAAANARNERESCDHSRTGARGDGGNGGPPAGGGTARERGGASGGTSKAAAAAAAAGAPSPHVILCLPSDVTDTQLVKKAYRGLVMKWHPDKWCGRDPTDMKRAEEQFKLIQSAYETLLAQLH